MDHPRTVLAIDGNSLVHRSYHAQAHTGEESWAVRGLLTQLVAAVDRVRPVAVVVGFDDPDRSVRRERWPSYKANRGDKLETLVDQLDEAVAAMRRLGVSVVVPEGYEADDVLASTAAAARRADVRTVVMTSDRDAFALIDETTTVLRIINGGVDASPMMTPDRLVLLLGVRPEQYRDFAALRGDPSDNLPGVRGIGPRTAARLLTEFGTAAAAFDDLEAVRARLGVGVASKLDLTESRDAWALNCEVMAMRDDLSVGLNLETGSGVLPLPAQVVASVFRAHRLTWSVSQAIRVLAEVEVEVAGPTFAESKPTDPLEYEGPSTGRSWRASAARTLPLLATKQPKVEQLVLF